MSETLRILFAGALLGATSPAAAVAQTAATFPVTGMQVVVGVPPVTLRLAPAGFRTTEARVTVRPGGQVLVNGAEDWQGSGFAVPKVFTVADVKSDVKSGMLQVRLDRMERRQLRDRVKIFIPFFDTAAALRLLLAPAADSTAVIASSYDAIGRRLFGAVADSIPPPIRRRILEVADSMLAGEAVTVASIDGRPYLEFKRTQPDDYFSVWMLSSTNSQLATVLNNVRFPFVEMMAGTKAPLPGGFGFCSTYRFIANSPGIPVLTPPVSSHERLTICVGAPVAAEFAAGRISRQELVDQSRVEYEGKTVSVDLGQ